MRLFTTLARFDPVYHGHFKCNRSKLSEMPVLWAYARDLFQTSGFGDTTDFVQIKQPYYIVHSDINPTGIVPKTPELAGWLSAHGREALGGRPFGDGSPPGPTPEAERVPADHGAWGLSGPNVDLLCPNAPNLPDDSTFDASKSITGGQQGCTGVATMTSGR